MPEELKNAEMSRIRSAQEDFKSRMKNGEFKTLSPFVDDKGIIRVGGRIDKAVMSYEEKHPVLASQRTQNITTYYQPHA